jgi:predicted nucleic acid-binding protein
MPNVNPQQVILDTNILVAAAFNPHSHSAQIIDAIRAGDFDLVWHHKTLAECQRIIRKIPPIHWHHFEDLFKPENEYTGTLAVENFTQITDPDDRKFAALAAATDAILVSNDQHFHTVNQLLNIRLMSPREFVTSIR